MTFRVFNAMGYTGMPSIADPMLALNQGSADTPAGVLAGSGQAGDFFFDWEPNYLESATLTAPSVSAQCLSLLTSARAASPNARFGFYDLPYGDYASETGQMILRPIDPSFGALLEASDFVCPSLYLADTTPGSAGWFSASRLHIAQFRSLTSKPVYPFLWPKFFDAPNAWVPTDVWAAQLLWVMDHCDGLVLWGNGDWDASAPWWLATKQILAPI